jgi:hypothetical protein
MDLSFNNSSLFPDIPCRVNGSVCCVPLVSICQTSHASVCWSGLSIDRQICLVNGSNSICVDHSPFPDTSCWVNRSVCSCHRSPFAKRLMPLSVYWLGLSFNRQICLANRLDSVCADRSPFPDTSRRVNKLVCSCHRFPFAKHLMPLSVYRLGLSINRQICLANGSDSIAADRSPFPDTSCQVNRSVCSCHRSPFAKHLTPLSVYRLGMSIKRQICLANESMSVGADRSAFPDTSRRVNRSVCSYHRSPFAKQLTPLSFYRLGLSINRQICLANRSDSVGADRSPFPDTSMPAKRI